MEVLRMRVVLRVPQCTPLRLRLDTDRAGHLSPGGGPVQ